MKTWGCQYQGIDIDALAASSLDLIVIDPMVSGDPPRPITRAEIARLARTPDGGRRLVVGYLSIGEAAAHRPYWQAAWETSPPPWLGPANRQWPGAHAVRYWEAGWQTIVSGGWPGALEALVGAGFDGVFLDGVDVFMRWQGERASAADDMVAFVARLADAARAGRPDFLFIGQNAEPLLARRDYRDLIDAVSKESLLYGVRGPGLPNTGQDIAWSRAGLDAARRDGLAVLAIEYVADARQIAAARRQLAAWGYVPFFADRLLDRLPGTVETAPESAGRP